MKTGARPAPEGFVERGARPFEMGVDGWILRFDSCDRKTHLEPLQSLGTSLLPELRRPLHCEEPAG